MAPKQWLWWFYYYAIPITVVPQTVHATDFNKDGKMDIMVFAALNYVYLNDGSQNFSETLLTAGFSNMHGLADIDRDGDTDIMYGNSWADRSCNRYDAGSSATITGTGRSEKTGDLDNDGDIDFVKATSSVSALQLNDGYLNWTALNIDISTTSTDIADFDGDGDFDIISSLNNSTLAWYDNNLNTPTKNFGTRKVIGTALNHRWLTAADLDGDGDADIAAVSQSSNRVVWHRNQLNETSNNFSAALSLPNSTGPTIVKAADLNGDGTMDLMILSNTDKKLSWFANNAVPSLLPAISSFTPISGPVGTTVIITGTNFSTTLTNNSVKFNGTAAVVSASTSTNITVTVPANATTGKITVTVAGNTATSATDFTVTTGTTISNQPPDIQSTTIEAPVNGKVTLDLAALLSDPDDNLDISSLKIIVPPLSGAIATIDGQSNLILDYTGISFSGTEKLTIEVCDLSASCTQNELDIEVAGDVIVYNAVSPNGDGKNDFLFLQYIEVLAETKKNSVTILNRWGSVVWEGTNYDNTTIVFDGKSKSGNELPSGNYFYKIEYEGGRKNKTGFFTLKR